MNPSPAAFFFLVAVSAGLSLAVFAHATKRGNRHATAWGIVAFLGAGLGVLIYFARQWWVRRRAS